jgi:uncharacterized protein (TIGR04222 family)
MNAEQLRQYQQILDFPLDEPDTHCRFRERLARENRWSASHADRVIAEYRRFALLAVTSGHPVSPSDSVDQAWHLHLLDTRSYWGKFCPEALNHPLHHLPNRGGAAEREKLVDWYRRTLVSYARLFGEAPPQDIWPPAEQRFATASHFVRIDTRSHWLIAKPDCPQWLPRLSCTAGFCLGLGLFLLLPVGCALSPDDWEPIDPARYRWFISLMALAIALWLLVRRKATGTQSPSVREIKPDDLDPYEWAYLVDGPKRVLQAALLRLIHLDCVELDAQTKVLDALPAADPDHGLHPIERRIFLAIGNGCTVSGLHRAEAPLTKPINLHLQDLGLLINPNFLSHYRHLPVWLVSLAAGAVMYWIGHVFSESAETSTLRSVAALMMALYSWVFLSRPPYRSASGTRLVQSLRPWLETDELPDDARLLNFARYGVIALNGSALQPMFEQLYPKAARTTTHRQSGDGGCGGCGGGGCGGCGGCGG